MNYLEVIKEHGLCVRQIPKEVTSLYSMHHHKEGNEIVYSQLGNHINYFPFKEKMGHRDDYIFNDKDRTVKRAFTKETKTPKYAGFWMCKVVKNTSSSVIWSYKTDNLAPTLEKSIELFLKTHKNEN